MGEGYENCTIEQLVETTVGQVDSKAIFDQNSYTFIVSFTEAMKLAKFL